MLISSSLFSQIPRDTSYTVKSTVDKVSKKYPHLQIEGVRPISPESVEVVKGITYKNFDGRVLYANLFFPKRSSNNAAVILIHGGGWRTGNPEMMSPLAERIAEAGYFVMVPEYRLSLEAKYPAAVNDLKDAIDWMKDHSKEYKIDSDQIAVIGCSAGGQLAALLGTTEEVQAVVDIDGILAFKHPDSKEGDMAAQWLGGYYDEIPEVWNQASALSHVSQSTPPTLFLGSKYPRFLAGHREYMQVLKNAGTYTEVQILEDAPHSFWLLTPWFEPTVDFVIDFLNKTLNRKDIDEKK